MGFANEIKTGELEREGSTGTRNDTTITKPVLTLVESFAAEAASLNNCVPPFWSGH